MTTDKLQVRLQGVNDTGLVLDDNVTFGEWAKLGERVAKVETALPWVIGDWLIYGEKHYGERFVQVAESIGKKPSTLIRYRWVARVFPPESRAAAIAKGVAWSVFAEMAGLEDDERQKCMEKVVSEGWRLPHVRAFRRTLRAAKTGEPLPTERRCVDCGCTPAELKARLKQGVVAQGEDSESGSTN
jgi:hypothetical protein